MELFAALYFYGAVFMFDCHHERDIHASLTRDEEKAVLLDQMELRRLRAFLRADYICGCIRSGVAHSRNLANYNCSRGALISFVLCQTRYAGRSAARSAKDSLVSLGTSMIILIGAALIQLQHAEALSGRMLLFSVLPVVIAAFAYPLGNRRMLEEYGGRLDTFQRVLGMTLASLPFWLILAAYGWWSDGLPQQVKPFNPYRCHQLRHHCDDFIFLGH